MDSEEALRNLGILIPQICVEPHQGRGIAVKSEIEAKRLPMEEVVEDYLGSTGTENSLLCT